MVLPLFNRMNFSKLLLHATILLGTQLPVMADTVMLSPSKDNTLFEEVSGQTSNGQGIFFYVGKSGAGLRRGVLAFDLSVIPSNATVISATLSLFMSHTAQPTQQVDISLHRALRDWGEGASDAGDPGGSGTQSQPGDATWIHTFYDTIFWTNAGGDFSSGSSATTTVMAQDTTYVWSGPFLTSDVQAWVANGATNFGWVILGNEADSTSAKRFNSRENLSNPPQLTVTYQISGGTPTPTPTGTPSATATATPTATTTATPTATATATPTATPSATPSATATATPTATATATPGQLGNISTRLKVETGDNAMIGGFIVTGTQPKRVIVRAIGPSLTAAGVPGALANPILELHTVSQTLATNDNWMDAPNRQEIIDSTLAPANDMESAILMTLPANNTGYTAIVRGVNDGTGVGLVEAYDLDPSADSKLANISTRGLVQTDDNVMIGGFIMVGNTSKRVIVRAIGPSLTAAGVPGALANPILELHDSNGGTLATNDNWMDAPNRQEIIDSTLAPTNDLESAILMSLPANNARYTAIVRGVDNTTGVALVEVYGLN